MNHYHAKGFESLFFSLYTAFFTKENRNKISTISEGTLQLMHRK